jgi:hypothetical protein
MGSTASQGASASGASGAGGAGASDAGVRDGLIDAVIDAAGEQDASVPESMSWRSRQGSSLTPDFLLPVLNYMRRSNVCWQQTRRCVEVCVLIASDCKPCAADAQCSTALKQVCGATIAACKNP